MGQYPFATVLTCADSRVPAELVFDQGVGDLFVVRTAGHVVDNAVRGTLGFGAHVLKTPLIVVLGHTSCGAVTAAWERTPVPPDVDPIILGISPEALATPSIQEAVAEHVRQTVAALKPRITATEGVGIEGAVYDIHSGRVRWLT